MSRPAASPVSEHMTASVVSVMEDTSLVEIVKTLRRLDISCVLVTTTAGAPVGIVSLSDLGSGECQSSCRFLQIPYEVARDSAPSMVS